VRFILRSRSSPFLPQPRFLLLSLTRFLHSLPLTSQNSLQILRDNSTLSLHLRNYPLHLANRITLLQLRPNERRNWITLALGFAINGEPERAEEVLEGLSKMVKVSAPFPIEERGIRAHHFFRFSLFLFLRFSFGGM